MLREPMPKTKTKVVLISVFLLLGVGFSAKWLKQVGFVPIEVVTLTDKLQHADPVAIKVAVKDYLRAGFFGLKVGAIREELKQIPWIADANVQRCWPNMVKIKIFERQPMAVWEGRGVVDTEGKLFIPPNVHGLEHLPEFIGSNDNLDLMVDNYLRILAALKPIGLAVKKLEIMPDQGWRAMLDNGVTIVLGQIEIEERLERFVLAYPIVGSGAEQVKVVDLRYTNGLSIG